MGLVKDALKMALGREERGLCELDCLLGFSNKREGEEWWVVLGPK